MTATSAADAPSPAVAPPPGNPRFALFDSLRGLAALAIILFHVASLSGGLDLFLVGDVIALLGPRSLTLFFVISGFLLYRPYVAARAAGRPPPRTSRYLRRRALRIVPGYWAALTVLAIYPGLVGVFSEDWWRYYGFLQLYSDETLAGGIPVAWSLSVEVSYYLLLPIFALGVGRVAIGSGRRNWVRSELAVLAVAAAGGAVVQVAAAQRLLSDNLASSLLGQITWLALGMALAVWSVAAEHGGGRSRVVRFAVDRPGLCWLGAGAAFAALIAVVRPGGSFEILQALTTAQPAGETVAAIALTLAAMTLFVLPAVFGEDAGGPPRQLLAWWPVAWLGIISYGLFLWHLPVAQLIARPEVRGTPGLDLVARVGFADTPVLFAATLAATVALAAASYYLVELPFLRRK